ncbi:hypothetical protein [uncultured Martelella sp.]|uniref:hypothetical protein n=1 Tax=uncultured Martelella sp. TaxID=392331 RepID=UPI0029C9453E|nr:hypothetical protein [uncultured Martelella sp.]
MKSIFLAVCVAAVALSGCARRPDAITATTIPMQAYTGDSCSSLRQQLANEKSNLSALSKQQNDAANGDAFGVFLVGVPLSSLSGGDKEGEISNAKGKINAMEAAMHKKGCKGA